MCASKTCRLEAALCLGRPNVHFFRRLSEVRCSQMHVQPLTALYFGESSAATDVILLMSSGCLDFGPSGSSSRPFAAPCAPHKVAKSPNPPRILSNHRSG